MFKKHSIQVKVIKDSEQEAAPTRPTAVWTPERITLFAKDQIQYAAIVGGVLYAGKKILDTTCQIALLKATR